MPALPKRTRFRDRLLAEATRVFEEVHGEARETPEELERIRRSEEPLERRVVRRAAGLATAPALRDALDRLRQVLVGGFLLALVLSLFAGATATHAALGFGRTEEINVFVVLSALLGVQSALLFAYLVIALVSPAGAAIGSVGGGLIGLARRWFRRFHRGEHQAAAAAAFGLVVTRTSIGKWTVGALSNGLWAAFNVGALGALLLLLSTRHYAFVWETTILSPKSFATVTELAGRLPGALGFETPTAEEIGASQWAEGRKPEDATRVAWSGFLIGCLTVYGLAPRLLLFLLCAGARLGARRRYRLDLERPGFSRLRSRLLPTAARLGVVDPDEGERPAAAPRPRPRRGSRPFGDPAVLGVEIDEPGCGWPPPLEGLRWNDLGLIDDGKHRRSVLEELAEAETEPSTLVCVCGLPTTPDRGIRSFVEDLRARVSSDLVLVLTGGHVLRKRTDAEGVRQRVDDWRRLAERAGVAAEHIVEVDLDHLTAAGAEPLRAALGRGSGAPVAAGRLEAAFETIVTHARRWPGEPGLRERAALQRELTRLYGGRTERLRELLRIPRSVSDDMRSFGGDMRGLSEGLTGRLDASARRAVDLLPARLKQSPKWIAAGAASGAVACIATALAAGPVALAALPSWSVVGGVIGGLVRTLRPESAEAAGAEPQAAPGFAQAIRSAVLFALLLELQGHGEERITRLLDRALEDDDAELGRPEDVPPWLDAVRRRLERALASGAVG